MYNTNLESRLSMHETSDLCRRYRSTKYLTFNCVPLRIVFECIFIHHLLSNVYPLYLDNNNKLPLKSMFNN